MSFAAQPPDAITPLTGPPVEPPPAPDAAMRSGAARLAELTAEAAATPSLVGLTIKQRYTLWECIGAGLQAQAYLAYDNLLEGKVVVKVLSTEIEGIPLPLPDSWEEEAKKAMRVRNCPYIASVTDLGQETLTLPDGSVREVAFIVWEYVRGTTLDEYAETATDLTLEFLLDLAQQLTQVLRVLHASDLVHGDLHSKNVMLDRDPAGRPAIKVIDFGLSHQGTDGKGLFRDLRSAHRILHHLMEQRRASLGTARLSERDQEFSAIVAQFGMEPSGDHAEHLVFLESALHQLARRHLAMQPAISTFETLDELFPWSQTVLAQTYSFRAVPCVGRQELIQRVLGTLSNALQEGHGTILLLRGESGVGKKRLAWEALHDFCLAHHEVFLLTARGHRGSGVAPFSAVRQMLRSFLGEHRQDDYPRLLSLLLPDSQPLIAPLIDFLLEEQPGAGGATGLGSTAFEHLIARILAKISLQRPLILWVSDVQYLDDPSRQCLLQIARDTTRFPLILVGTYGAGDLDAGGSVVLLEEWLTAMRGLGCLELPVKVLPRPQVAQFIAAALPWPGLPPEHALVDALWMHSGGNPYLLQESLSYLMQAGILESTEDRGWLVDTVALQDLGTSSIQLLLERRLQQLDPFQREVLDLAACWGSDFPESDVTLLFRERSVEATAALYTAQEQGLLVAQRPGTLSFQPYALWEILVQQLTPEQRRRNHLRVAAQLQAREESQLSHEAALTIARHWEIAGDAQRALEYCQIAADRALLVRANEAALDACQMALHLIGQNSLPSLEGSRLTALTHLQQAKAYRYLGDQAAQEEYAVKAFEGAVIARDAQLELRALKAMGEYYRSIADYESSTDYFRQGLDIATELNDRGRRARFHKEMGVNFYLLGDMAAAEAEYQQAISINLELGDAEGLARVYNNLGMICRNRGEWTAAKDWFEKAIAHFQEAGESRGLVLPMGNMAIIYTEEGEYEKAMILLKELLKNEVQLGEARLRAKIRVTLGDVQAEIGEDAEALENYEHSLQVYQALGDRQGECEVLTNIAAMYFEQGKLDLAEQYHRLGLDLKREIGYEWGVPLDHYDLARVHLSRRETQKALQSIDQGLEIAQRLRMHELEFSLHVLQVAALELEGATPARELARRYEHLLELYPDVKRGITKQRQLMFLVQVGTFFKQQNSPAGEQLLEEARSLLRQLARRLIRPERKTRFWEKYRRLFPHLDVSARA